MFALTENRALHFLTTMVRNPKSIGAIAPSSRRLAERMVEGLSLQDGDLIVELGPGTGAFTRQISQILPASTAYLGIEREPRFVKLLKSDFPGMRFIAGDAAHLQVLVSDADRNSAKVIISGLPFAILDRAIRERIIEGIDAVMRPGMVFRTMQYIHAYPLPSAIGFRRAMSARFGAYQRSKVVLGNLPPAYVLTWQR